MIFANPLLLIGTALVALPIVLHLLMRRRPRHIEFPAIRFVQRRHDVNRRQLRLRHWLLLALRAAVIAILALALARPTVKFSGTSLGSQEAPVAAALIFDTAPRMEYRQENRTRLDVAREFGQKLLAQLPRESRVAVLDTRLGAAAVFQADRGSARQRIERLETVANSQSLVSVIEEALKLIGPNELPHKEVYVFTDLSQAAWPASAATRLQERLAEVPGTSVYLIDVGFEKPVDFGLGELRLSSQVLSHRTSLQIDTDLISLGLAGERTVELFLLGRDGKPQKAGVQTCRLAAGGTHHLEFRASGLELGTHQGFVRVAGQDGLAADDTRYFTVEVKPAWKVLLVAPHPTANYTLYLNQALAPTSFRQHGRAPFECKTISVEQLADFSLAPYAAVCLVDPTPLAPAVWRKLVNFTSDGRGVAVFLGRNAKAIDSFNEAAAQELLAGKLLRQSRDPSGTLNLAPRDYQHPALSAFRDYAGANPWNDFPVFRYWELDALPQGVNVVIPYRDGRPALLERPVGSGRVLIMTTPISDRPDRDPWNLLPVGEAWPFVILANQMLSYLVGSADEQLNYLAGQAVVLRLDRQSPRTPYVVTLPNDEKVLQSPDAGKGTLTFSSADRAGNYRVQAGGESSGVDRGFSVNLAPDQTDLSRLAEDRLQPLFGKNEFRLVRSEDQLDRAVSTARVGREMFPLLILLVAMILGAEQVVANRFYKE